MTQERSEYVTREEYERLMRDTIRAADETLTRKVDALAEIVSGNPRALDVVRERASMIRSQWAEAYPFARDVIGSAPRH